MKQGKKRDDIEVYDVVFRAAEDFGKDMNAWPADLRAAFRRALGNLRDRSPHLGQLIDGEIEILNSPSIVAVGFPFVYHVVGVFEKRPGVPLPLSGTKH